MGSCPVDHTFGPLVDTMAEEDSEQVAGQTGRKELGVRSFLHSRERGWWNPMVESNGGWWRGVGGGEEREGRSRREEEERVVPGGPEGGG